MKVDDPLEVIADREGWRHEHPAVERSFVRCARQVEVVVRRDEAWRPIHLGNSDDCSMETVGCGAWLADRGGDQPMYVNARVRESAQEYIWLLSFGPVRLSASELPHVPSKAAKVGKPGGWVQ
jgi:hypothetical protein